MNADDVLPVDYPVRKPKAWVYVEGKDRNEQDKAVSHIYTGPDFGDLRGPLCARGWNRSDGFSFSIFRENTSDAGTCMVCERRMRQGMGPVAPAFRKTRWI